MKVLITGANKGIGLEMAKMYAEAGNEVIGCARNPDAATKLKALPGVRVEQLDVGSSDSVAALKARLGDEAIDVLINNAGIAGPAPDKQSALDMDYDGWMETFNINSMGPLRMVQAFRANLAKGTNPKAITVTSQMGALDLNWPVMYAYCSSKAAVNKVMRMISVELAKDGIAVRLLHPGHVKTDMGGPNAAITVDESAGGIIKVIADTNLENTGTFMKWNGEAHAW
ncbi:MAG: SDR family oxidoreductase [Pseudomonadales bacterium]|nr:SDR family oxidoreductase [Caldilineaceae bacterium]MCP5178802.1 SDR family oxidoreductase [Pseudomonadales bacterium]MCP5185888.1 SDR family oxidoreductase [Pseudomonadales bacterium]